MPGQIADVQAHFMLSARFYCLLGTCYCWAVRLNIKVCLQTGSAAAKAVLDGCAARLEGLWGILSQCIARIEEGLGSGAPQQTQLLPPEAAQARSLHY